MASSVSGPCQCYTEISFGTIGSGAGTPTPFPACCVFDSPYVVNGGGHIIECFYTVENGSSEQICRCGPGPSQTNGIACKGVDQNGNVVKANNKGIVSRGGNSARSVTGSTASSSVKSGSPGKSAGLHKVVEMALFGVVGAILIGRM
jgi:hypothetical protein